MQDWGERRRGRGGRGTHWNEADLVPKCFANFAQHLCDKGSTECTDTTSVASFTKLFILTKIYNYVQICTKYGIGDVHSMMSTHNRIQCDHWFNTEQIPAYILPCTVSKCMLNACTYVRMYTCVVHTYFIYRHIHACVHAQNTRLHLLVTRSRSSSLFAGIRGSSSLECTGSSSSSDKRPFLSVTSRPLSFLGRLMMKIKLSTGDERSNVIHKQTVHACMHTHMYM